MRQLQMRLLRISISALAIIFLFFNPSMAADHTAPGKLTHHSTLRTIGLEWNITGDDDHDATCKVRYRIQGASGWKPFLPLYRVDYNGANTLAGSILFLHPETTYEVNLDLTDPDGGSVNRTEIITTRRVPMKPVGGRTFNVVPGSGGGDGSEGRPFRGITAAQGQAEAGDIFLLHAGNYGGEIEFNISGRDRRFIVWQNAGDGEVILNGIRVNADYIWLEGLTVNDRDYGLLTYSSPEGVVIHKNRFNNCHNAINLNHGGNNWTITDNLIIGDQIPGACSGNQCYSGEGIELQHTSGHVVAYNTISRVGDGISYPHQNCDIYGNDIFDTADDGIELDYGYANLRCWGNRISNPKNNGISFQPVNGAPWYVLRNQVASPLESVIKFRGADRALVAHNTLVGWSGAVASAPNFLSKIQSHNNLWISIQDRYAWESGSAAEPEPFWGYQIDYDGFDWGQYPLALKWSGVRYATLEAFSQATGIESHGIRIDRHSCFETMDVVAPTAHMPPQYLTLLDSCNAKDAGLVLPGINEAYLGDGPDLGAYEIGAPLPHYGKREADLDQDGDMDGSDLAQLSGQATGLEELTAYFARHWGE